MRLALASGRPRRVNVNERPPRKGIRKSVASQPLFVHEIAQVGQVGVRGLVGVSRRHGPGQGAP